MKKFLSSSRISKYVIATLLLISNTSFAGLYMPIGVNDLYIYDKHNSLESWVFTIQGLELVDVGGVDYLKIRSCNESGDGICDEVLMRSTENAVYSPDGSIGFQIAPIGTTWNTPKYHDDLGTGINVHEIIAIETVAVPYGTFNNAYVHQVYFNPDDPLLDNTPYWYDYIVPDVGWVKQVDYWSNPTEILELRDITTVPIPATILLFVSGLAGLAGVRIKRS
jgi:hypothetical protein